jgi:hypothetical protein
VSVPMAQASLDRMGYVVLTDANQSGLDPGFRAEVLPQYAELLREDIYAVPPADRRRVCLGLSITDEVLTVH